ncbi:MAG: hypothetical protein EOO36_24515, partial [Cytophagaceae bacterium]
MNPRDLPEVVAELIIEVHEVRSELQGLNGCVDRLERRMAGVESEIKLVREENRQNTGRLIEAFGRSMEPLINRVLDHDARLGGLE